MAVVTVDDVTARLGRPAADDTETARITAFIEDATALVLDWCLTDFEHHQDETFDLLITDGEVEIPSRYFPGLVVSAVSVDGAQLDPDQWKILGRSLLLRNAPEAGTVTLTASWGWPAVPPVIKSVVCAEVIRWIAVSPGTLLEKTGELEVQYAPTAANQGLSIAAKDSLKRYRKRSGTLTFERTRTRPGWQVRP